MAAAASRGGAESQSGAWTEAAVSLASIERCDADGCSACLWATITSTLYGGLMPRALYATDCLFDEEAGTRATCVTQHGWRGVRRPWQGMRTQQETRYECASGMFSNLRDSGV